MPHKGHACVLMNLLVSLHTIEFSFALGGLRGWAKSRIAAAALSEMSVPHDCDHSGAPSRDHPADSSSSAVLFSEPSTLDGSMRVEVLQKHDGWRELCLVGMKRQIIHGSVRLQPDGKLDARAAVPEYVKSQVAMAIAGMEIAVGGRRVPRHRVLVLGLGAGMAPSLLSSHLGRSSVVAVELDGSVCRAAVEWLGLDSSRTHVVQANALEWVQHRARSANGADAFDAVLIDIFDER